MEAKKKTTAKKTSKTSVKKLLKDRPASMSIRKLVRLGKVTAAQVLENAEIHSPRLKRWLERRAAEEAGS
jgi:hypothetical protein